MYVQSYGETSGVVEVGTKTEANS